jgi:hypothetical protein
VTDLYQELESQFDVVKSTDVLSHHHRNMKRPLNPHVLQARVNRLEQRGQAAPSNGTKRAGADSDAGSGEDAENIPPSSQKRRRVARNTLTAPGTKQPTPDQLGYYSPKFQTILMDAKIVYRIMIAVEYAFPNPDQKQQFSEQAFDIASELHGLQSISFSSFDCCLSLLTFNL